jgi:hypothetical protein
MRLSKLLFIIFLFTSLSRQITAQDSLIRYKPIYTNKEFKKEKKDIKEFVRLLKTFEKAAQTSNIDFINTSFEKMRARMDQENLELNSRISDRSIRINPPKPKDYKDEDRPKGYNTTLEPALTKVDKNTISEKRSETAILMKYSQVLNKQNAIVRKLKNIKEFESDVSNDTYKQVLADGKSFQETMVQELELMKFEKGKKDQKAK